MEFIPEDIAERDFLPAFGGFDREEVRQFLEAVAEQVRDKNRQIAKLSKEIQVLEASHVRAPAPAQQFEESVLVELQKRSSELILELHSVLNEALALVSEMRASKQVPGQSQTAVSPEPTETSSRIDLEPEASEPPLSPGVETTEPSSAVEIGSVAELESSEPLHAAGPDASTARAPARVDVVEPPPEWDDLLSEPASPERSGG